MELSVRHCSQTLDTKKHALEAYFYSILSTQANGKLYAKPRAWLAVKVFNFMMFCIPSNNITEFVTLYTKLWILTRPDSKQKAKKLPHWKLIVETTQWDGTFARAFALVTTRIATLVYQASDTKNPHSGDFLLKKPIP